MLYNSKGGLLSCDDIENLRDFDKCYNFEGKTLVRKLTNEDNLDDFYHDIRSMELHVNSILYFDGVFEVWAVGKKYDNFLSLSKFKDVIQNIKKMNKNCEYRDGEIAFIINKSAAFSLMGDKFSYLNVSGDYVKFIRNDSSGILFDELIPYIEYVREMNYNQNLNDKKIAIKFNKEDAGLFSGLGKLEAAFDDGLLVFAYCDDKEMRFLD